MATINGLDMRTARFRGEMHNATGYTSAQFTAYVLVDGVQSWLGRVRPVVADITLRRGYSSQDHLFDRTAERVAEAVEGKLYPSMAAMRTALGSVPQCECSYTVDLTDTHTSYDVPPELEAQAKLIRDKVAAKEAAADKRRRRKFVSTLILHLADDSRWRVTTREAAGRNEWITDIAGVRRLLAYGLTADSGPRYVGLSLPTPSYATEAEAVAVLDTLRGHYA